MTAEFDLFGAQPWHRLRRTSYDAIYVSPHLDDAVYSCGGQIALARREGARILLLTHFGTGRDPVPGGGGLFGDLLQRKREERAAADLLDIDYVFLNAPDAFFRKMRPADLLRYTLSPLRLPESSLRQALRAVTCTLIGRLLAPTGRAYVPLAIGAHPDHRETYEIGRALHAEQPQRVLFYEDVPYALVSALRAQRLRQVAFPHAANAGLNAEAREVADFVFAQASPLARRLGRALAAAHITAIDAFLRVTGSRDPIGAHLQLEERDISAVIDTKVAAIRAYVTQTNFFFPPGDAIYDVLARSGDRYVERVWTLAAEAAEPAAPLPAGLLAQARECVDALEHVR